MSLATLERAAYATEAHRATVAKFRAHPLRITPEERARFEWKLTPKERDRMEIKPAMPHARPECYGVPNVCVIHTRSPLIRAAFARL